MKLSFRVTMNDNDITANLQPRLLQLKITDKAGIESDHIEITVDDRDHVLAIPPKDGRIQAWLGYGKALADMGLFVVEDVKFQGSSPRTMTVSGKAADLAKSLQKVRSRYWDKTPLGEIVRQIAGEHGFEAKVDAELAGIMIDHLDQTRESDANLLTRIAKRYGAIFKAAAGKLLFARQGTGKSVSGGTLPTIDLTPGQVTRWNVTINKRGGYTKVRTYYQDHAKGRTVTVDVGSGPNLLQDATAYPDLEAAKSAADARLDQIRRNQASLDLTLPGRNDLMAQSLIKLSGFRDGVDGTWLVESVEHKLSGAAAEGGYSCTVKAVSPPTEAVNTPTIQI